jgi:hypothetical protein
LGYSKDLISEALGHEYGNKITGIYLDHYENTILDSMSEKVIAAVGRNPLLSVWVDDGGDIK